MRKKALIVIGVFTAFLVIQACSPAPEKTLLKKYFNAVQMNDNDTMSSMALEPLQPELGSWSVVSIGPDSVVPATLPALNAAEIEAKKAQDAQIGPTLDADTAVKDAQFEMDTTRSASAKAALKKQVEQLQAKYDIENGKMQELKKAYNAAKTAASSEEEQAMFSLGLRELPTIRELAGDVHTKDVVISITNRAGVKKDYKLLMKQYVLKDTNGRRLSSRWVIIKFEPLA